MYGCQNWQCSAGDPPESTAKKYKKTTYKKIQNDGVQVENPGTTTLRKILLYTCTHKHVCVQKCQPNKQVVTYHIDTLFIVPNSWLF